jgi:hypothetical protein
VIILDKLLIGGIGWVLRRVADAASSEEPSEVSLREELLAAQMRLELGEIDEGEFRVLEERILARMRAARSRQPPEAMPRAETRYTLEAIEADVGSEVHPEGLTSPARRRKRASTRRRR